MHAIQGQLTLHNGNVINWEQFIQSASSREEAEQTAMQIVCTQHKEPIENCRIDLP